MPCQAQEVTGSPHQVTDYRLNMVHPLEGDSGLTFARLKLRCLKDPHNTGNTASMQTTVS